MIVDDCNGVGAVRRPDEANAKLPVDANTVLPAPILLQGLQLIAWWDPKRFEGDSGIELIQLATRHGPGRVGTSAPRATRVDAVEYILGAGIAKGANHQRVATNGMGER